MNKKTVSIVIILAGLAGMLTFACEEKNASLSGDGVQTTGENTPPEAVPGIVLHGILEWSDPEGLVLVNELDRYGLKSDSDLNQFIGKQILVTGTLETEGPGNIIQVVQVMEEPESLTE